ncbi:putative FERM domain-containing protein FRMD8P1 isoform X2 [Lingula anatina]|nr:putative FERM domain-containing protein FRMD8P1 isoform X2 [Lingula anatina]XP_013420445.1 putative FERM domain-containing protein FRMD8P1 isoform X2 [Lingula anatina]XP_013420446.1 putative FERM domain-containing protein FRMD8P1 isoform X2 [Lingula anatina]|eukprot:XP_013420444.1 putative FERM domain-containing protein FRMD8P1 isoform X2 [Lingula anatina]
MEDHPGDNGQTAASKEQELQGSTHIDTEDSVKIPPPPEFERRRSQRERGSFKDDKTSTPQKTRPPPLAAPQISLSPKAMDICVFLPDMTGIQMTLEDGKNATASEIFELVKEELELPASSASIFSLWLTSPLLEVQLKPHHSPFKLTMQWDEFLRKYTVETEDEILRDEPSLVFQRSVYCSRAREEMEADPKVLRLLYQEAVRNVVEGRYPCEEEVYLRLAGLQALETMGAYNPETHTEDIYEKELHQYFPDYVIAHGQKKLSRLFSSTKHPLVYKLVHSHQEFSQKKRESVDIYREYMQICWQFPFYGSAYFHGQIEKPAGVLAKIGIQRNPDTEITVAVNREGIFVIDSSKASLILGLPYEDLSWEYAESGSAKDNPNCQPCLFLQFEATENNTTVTKLLQIFSKEAKLMDALIETCVAILQETEVEPAILKEEHAQAQATPDNADLDCVDAPLPKEKRGQLFKILQSGQLCNKMDKLCLATFSVEGECIDKGNVRTP